MGKTTEQLKAYLDGVDTYLKQEGEKLLTENERTLIVNQLRFLSVQLEDKDISDLDKRLHLAIETAIITVNFRGMELPVPIRDVMIKRFRACSKCANTGKVPASHSTGHVQCPDCKGSK